MCSAGIVWVSAAGIEPAATSAVLDDSVVRCRCVTDLSLKDFPLPNLTEFLNVDLPKTSHKPTPIPRASDVVLPRNQWYYQYDGKAAAADAGGASAPATDESPRTAGILSTDSIVGATSLLAVLVAIDIIWFIHRMARTYSTARMILYGCPVYVACRRLAGAMR